MNTRSLRFCCKKDERKTIKLIGFCNVQHINPMNDVWFGLSRYSDPSHQEITRPRSSNFMILLAKMALAFQQNVMQKQIYCTSPVLDAGGKPGT